MRDEVRTIRFAYRADQQQSQTATVSRNYYERLGVSATATEAEIRAAYRRRALECHPDRHPNDPHAETRFKEITVAYEVLSDPVRRRSYDRLCTACNITDRQPSPSSATASSQGSAWPNAPTNRQRADSSIVHAEITLTLEEIFAGHAQRVRLTDAAGRPHPVSLTFPVGVADQTVLLVDLSRRGHADAIRLLVRVRVAPHAQFTRRGSDLLTKLTVPLKTAWRGGAVELKMLDGSKLQLTIPARTPHRRWLKLAGLGLPCAGGSGRGDLYVEVTVDVPPHPSDEERRALAALAS